MNNPNRDDFERMMELAEFGARRHDERRQVEFRVFIAYNTLLVFAFYQLYKIEQLNEPIWVTIGLVVIHIAYLLWQIRLSRALINDGWRRNFYLKKAECILQHLWKQPDVPFHPEKNIYVTITPGDKVDEYAEKGKISEYDLFNKHEPDIILVSPMLHVWKHWDQIWTDWSRPFQVLIPTIILNLLIVKLAGGWWALIVTLILIGLVGILRFSDVVLSKKIKKKSS